MLKTVKLRVNLFVTTHLTLGCRMSYNNQADYNDHQPSAPPPRTVSLMDVSPQPPDKPLPPMPPGHNKEKNKFFTYFLKKPGKLGYYSRIISRIVFVNQGSDR